jgi:ABC-2 type transport system ATP-binding protein
MPLIESFSLTKRFGEILAVDNLSLEVEQGEVLGFLGPNGAGKTTTIRMLAGIIAPTNGYAIVAGLRPDETPEQLHEAIGFLTESPGLYERLSAQRNLEYFAGFYSNLRDRRKDKVGNFSNGMKHRLALARALLHAPQVLFLGEPTAGLDPEAAHEVRGLIKKLSLEGRTIFLSTHNLNEAEHLCHRIAVIRARLLTIDTPENLRRRLFRKQVSIRLEIVAKPIIEAINQLYFVDNLKQSGNQLIIELSDPVKNRPELVKTIVQAGGRVLEVSQKQHSLEDVYLTLLKEEKGNEL